MDSGDPYHWKGYGWTGLLCLLSLLHGIVSQNQICLMNFVAVRSKSLIGGLVYRKVYIVTLPILYLIIISYLIIKLLKITNLKLNK